jgi:multicomponent Na+:H+ antiporter subunit E
MIIAVPVESESEEELAIISDLVTLTPGTLTLDVEDDGKTLLVHVLSADDAREVRRQIEEGLVRRVRRLFA